VRLSRVKDIDGSRFDPRTSPLVSVVIVNYNSGPYLVNSVRSLFRSTYPNLELIVVDNASDDDSVTRVEALYNQVEVIRNPVNVGYSKACNIGIKSAKGEFVVIMNPDTMADPDWLSGLLDATHRHPRGAFFQPKILLMDDPRILNSAGNMIHAAGFGVCRGIGTLDTERFQAESEVCYASGACVLARMEGLREIGLLEELFFAYGEDKDWGWRGMMMGWQSIYVPSSRILHKWSAALGRGREKFYLLEFERILSIWKNYSKRTLILLAPILLLVEVGVLLHAFGKGWLREKIRSYADLIGLRGIISERRRMIQNRRLVSDGPLVRIFVTRLEHPYIGTFTTVLDRLMSVMFARVRDSL
jgi:GT2 family glycosyltransferase